MIKRIMKYKMIFLFGVLLFFIFGLTVSDVYAQGGGGVVPPEVIELENPIKTDSVEGLLDIVLDALAIIAVPIAGAAILFGGYQMLFAGGDPEKFKTGTRTITYATIAFVIILFSKVVGKLITNILK